MRISDRFVMALRNLWRRKSRTILTILSVVIGSTSIILMLAFAEGINASQREMIEQFQGLNSIQIFNEMGELKVDDKMINELKRVANVEAVVPSKNVWMQIKVDGTDEYDIESGMTIIPDDVYKRLDKDTLDWGSIPAATDEDKILLGSDVSVFKNVRHGNEIWGEPAEDFDFASYSYHIQLGWESGEEEDDGVNFGKEEEPDDPNASKPETIDVPIEIAGQLGKGSILSGWEVYMSETAYKAIKKEDDKLRYPTLNEGYDDQGNPIKTDGKIQYDSLTVVIDKPENVAAAEADIRKLGYQTHSMAETSAEIENQSRTVMLILGGIGSIAFIVSAIGIINTMLMSIYERQKEIGVMKVIGASVSDVQNMFLIESGFIGFFGGILGLIISLLVARLINNMFGGAGDMMMGTSNIVVIPVWLMIVGVGFSALVGVLAGFLPARRATRLSAIDALRAN